MKHTKQSMLNQKELGRLLDFLVEYARKMIASGANIERVELGIKKICSEYSLCDVSLNLLTTYISIGAKTEEGVYASRQGEMPPPGIHLERLKNLNRVSYAICHLHPPVRELPAYLTEAEEDTRQYPDFVVLLGQMLGMASLCYIFKGSLSDLAAVLILTVILHFAQTGLAKLKAVPVASNAICMFLVTSVAIFLLNHGIGDQLGILLTVISMLVIPGIPLVNAVRNILCDNEMNGILQLIKAILETLSLVVGTYLSAIVFGGNLQW